MMNMIDTHPTNTATRTIMRLERLTIGYPGRSARTEPHVIAADLDTALYAGELVCLIGPNGAGKTTLMRTMAGTHAPLNGTVLLTDETGEAHAIHALSPIERARMLSVVLTDRVDPGLLTGYALVALGRHPYTDWSGRLSKSDEAAVVWAIEAVGAESLATRLVGELSDGERQRLMIGRALAQQPQVMILDEPTAFLDLPRRVEMMRLLRDIAHTSGSTILLSTHDLDLALRTADRLWLLSSDGTLSVGAPEDLILSGAFETVFNREGLTFNRLTGAFEMNAPQKAVRLVDSAENHVTAVWTGRALERAGFRLAVDAEAADFIVEIMTDNAPCWRITVGNNETETTEVHSLEALVNRLRHNL